ncbi:MAG: hypothetical protein PVJ53_04835 [Desulfobacterales bacterium]
MSPKVVAESVWRSGGSCLALGARTGQQIEETQPHDSTVALSADAIPIANVLHGRSVSRYRDNPAAPAATGDGLLEPKTDVPMRAKRPC